MSDDIDRQDSCFSYDDSESLAAESEADFEGEIAEEEGEVKYECLTPDDLIKTQLQHIQEVNTIFEISPGTARILLAHFNWDKEKLIERYYSGDQEKLFQEAHVVNPNRVPKIPNNPEEVVVCDICYMDFSRKEMTGLECGHLFCFDDWNRYLEIKICGESTSVIYCPAFNCNILVDELTISRLIGSQPVLKRYKHLLAAAYVQGNPHVRWCPSPGCSNAIKMAHIAARPVVCNCGYGFCFACGEQVHDPIVCAMLKSWLQKCADDSETSNWISANTKECPKCRATIEKNGGCNHVTCRSSACKYEFCWMCMGPWEPHGSSWYNCNRYSEKESVDAREEQSKSRQSLERYLFYYNRYANHEQSRKLEGKLRDMVSRKMAELQKDMSWIEVQFLSEALRTLSECRSTLKFTYVFAFYLTKNNQCEIFESNQKDLEMATETLSHYLENDVTALDPRMLKQNILNKAQYCDSRRLVLVKHVQEGYQRGEWEYNLGSMKEIMAAQKFH